jgi:hypothetical protein
VATSIIEFKSLQFFGFFFKAGNKGVKKIEIQKGEKIKITLDF